MNALTPYPLTPIGSFLGFVLALFPLPLQFHSWNIGVFMYGLWIAVYNLQMFVNTIIWRDNVNIVAPIWCDIVTRINIGASPGIRGCSLAICIHLYRSTTHRRASCATNGGSTRWKEVALDLLLTIGIPLLVMGTYIIIQPLRFDIMEEIGCQSTVYSYVTYVVYYGPQLVLSLASMCLAPFIIRAFLAHRREFKESLTSNPNVTLSRYRRPMLIACLDTLINLPFLIAAVIQEILSGDDATINYPYISWTNVHNGVGGLMPGASLSTILQTPAAVWSTNKWSFFTVKWNAWVYVFHAIVFFAVFGTTPEMKRRLCKVFQLFPGRFGRRFGSKNRHDMEKSMSDIQSGTTLNNIPSDATFSFNKPMIAADSESRLSLNSRSMGALTDDITSYHLFMGRKTTASVVSDSGEGQITDIERFSLDTDVAEKGEAMAVHVKLELTDIRPSTDLEKCVIAL